MWSRDPLIRRVLELDRAEALLPQNGRILAAVSGGADSMCLLQVLLELSEEKHLSVFAAHYHHGLRGAEADRDAEFVSDWCRERGVPCILGRGDVAAEAARRGLGIEETARLMRYQFLYASAEELNRDGGHTRIATAHNADDNAETMLLHLVRGTGLRGLTGIAPIRENLIRPLLTCTRAEIEAFNLRRCLPHVEDSTNEDLDYSRNFLRHQVMPLLRQMNPSLSRGLSRTAESLRRDNDLLEQQTAVLLRNVRLGEKKLAVPTADLLALEAALRPRGAELLFQQLCPEESLSAAHRLAIVTLAEGKDPSGRISLPRGLTARRQYDTLILEQNGEKEPPSEPVSLPLPGNVSWQGQMLSAGLEPYQGQKQSLESLYLRWEGEALQVRCRRIGDRLRLPKRPEKTIKKWLIDEKLPCDLRDSLPVFTDREGKPLGMLGLGADASAAPVPGQPAWHITLGADRRK